MSYLIALYVYYHGNNLARFGFVKGSQEIKDQNQGLRTIEDIQYSGVLPQQNIEIMKQQAQVRAANNYEEMMRQAIIKSQQQSYQLYQRGLVKNDLIERTPDGLLEEYDDAMSGSIDMGFFDELNGF